MLTTRGGRVEGRTKGGAKGARSWQIIMEMRQVKVIHPTVVIIAIDDIHCIHKHTHT